MKNIIIVVFLLIFSVNAWAACTSSTPDYTTLSACVSAADRGAEITVSAGDGTETWSSTLSLTKGVTLTGPGRDSLIITRTGGASITIAPDDPAISNEENIKITGFTFSGGNSSAKLMQITGNGATGTKPHKYIIIGDNRFKDSSTGGEAIHMTGHTRGVIYNNEFDRINNMFRPWGSDNYLEWENGYYGQEFGTADNIYFEDNSFTCSTSFGGGDSGWIESGQGGRMAVRYNSWDMSNCGDSEWIDVHGFQNWPGGQTGTFITEFYGNTIVNHSMYRGINHRGGWGMFFNNTGTGSGGLSHQINQYEAGDTGGSGCNEDVPGSFDGEVGNSYFWNMTNNAVSLLPTGGTEPIADGCSVSENVSYWNENASCSGSGTCSAGVGRGTTIPDGNCTVGVGFWVASTETITVDSDIIQAGHFYKCTSTNVWTKYYTPYTYPHPLRDEGTTPTPQQSGVSGNFTLN